MDRFQEQHLEVPECLGRHCKTCQVDEGLGVIHTVCPACNHVYITEKHLIADYLVIPLDRVEEWWEDFKRIVTMYCPRCLHIWGEGEKN